jgi:hypothetical protein
MRRCDTTRIIGITISIILRTVFKWSVSSYRLTPQSLSGIPRKIMVDSPRKAYLKTLVRRPRIPRCPNGNIHCEDICMGASRHENIGRYYYYVSNISGTGNMPFTYISSSAKHDLENRSLVSALRFIISQCTLRSARTNSGSSSRISMSGW